MESLAAGTSRFAQSCANVNLDVLCSPDNVNYCRPGQTPLLNNSPVIVLKDGTVVMAYRGHYHMLPREHSHYEFRSKTPKVG